MFRFRPGIREIDMKGVHAAGLKALEQRFRFALKDKDMGKIRGSYFFFDFPAALAF